MEIILNNINEKRKLTIVKYNKKIKIKLDIRFYDYLKHNEKYIKYKSETKVKEYDLDDNVIFIGEYLNGKRNGKGKEYNIYKEISFEGEYLNGKRNGKGKEHNYIDQLIFEGEYLNGNKIIN